MIFPACQIRPVIDASGTLLEARPATGTGPGALTGVRGLLVLLLQVRADPCRRALAEKSRSAPYVHLGRA